MFNKTLLAMLVGSALLLGLTGLVRAGPHIVLSLVGGVFADRVNRVRLIQAGQAMNAALLLALAAVTLALGAAVSAWQALLPPLGLFLASRVVDGRIRPADLCAGADQLRLGRAGIGVETQGGGSRIVFAQHHHPRIGIGRRHDGAVHRRSAVVGRGRKTCGDIGADFIERVVHVHGNAGIERSCQASVRSCFAS